MRQIGIRPTMAINFIFILLVLVSEVVVARLFIRHVDAENQINVESILNLSLGQESLGRAKGTQINDSTIYELYDAIRANFSDPVQEFENMQLSMAQTLNSYLRGQHDVDLDVMASIIDFNFHDWDIPSSFRLTLSDAGDGSVISSVDFMETKSRGSASIAEYVDDGHDRILTMEYDLVRPRRAFLRKYLWPMALLNLMILFLILVTFFLVRAKRRYERRMDDFVNIVAHNMKNPLAVAYSAGEALQAIPAVSDDELASKLIGINLSHLQELNHRVDDVLFEVRGLKYGDGPKQKVSILSVVQDLSKEYELRGVDMVMAVDVSPSHIVQCNDREHLAAVLRNLIDNSVKYSTGVAKVTVCTQLGSDGTIAMSVKDEGMGFSKADKKSAFLRYGRGARADTMSTEGFGMGLYYVKRVSDINGWKVSIHSEAECGSTVTICNMQPAHAISEIS